MPDEQLARVERLSSPEMLAGCTYTGRNASGLSRADRVRELALLLRIQDDAVASDDQLRRSIRAAE